MRRVFAALVLAWCAAVALAQPYTIRRFSVDAELNAKGSMTVTERIAVRFNESRRGIFRMIPVKYDTGRGMGRDIQFRLLGVTDDSGSPLQTHLDWQGRDVNIRVGNPDVWLPPGTETTYVFRYTVSGALNWIEHNSDWEPTVELYWNLTGDEWDAPMEAVDFRVRFPEVPAPKPLRARVYYGPLGSRLNDTISEPGELAGAQTRTTLKLSRSEVSGERPQPVPPHNGLTLVLALPYDSIAKPTPLEVAAGVASANLGLLNPLLMLLIFGGAWWKLGRDRKDATLEVQFEPPDRVSAEEAGTLLDETVDSRDIAGALVQLAVRGCLVFQARETGFLRKRTVTDIVLTGDQPKQPLSPTQEELLRLLRRCEQPIDDAELKEHVGPQVATLKKSVFDSLVARGYYSANPETTRGVASVLAVVAGVGLAVFLEMLTPTETIFATLVGGAVGVVIGLVFAWQMPRRTAMGHVVRSKVRGFEHFMHGRRSYMEWFAQKNPDQALFEEYLPYAVAFGAVHEWSKAFAERNVQNPSWYHSPVTDVFIWSTFAHDLERSTQRLAAAATTPPRSDGASGGSSGFGGGGFSGGGFGGGGGGSW